MTKTDELDFSIGGLSLTGYREYEGRTYTGIEGQLAYKGKTFMHFEDKGDGGAMSLFPEDGIDINFYRGCQRTVMSTLKRIVLAYTGKHKLSSSLVEVVRNSKDADYWIPGCEVLIEMLIELKFIVEQDRVQYEKAGESNYYYLAICDSVIMMEYVIGDPHEQKILSSVFSARSYDQAFSSSEKAVKERAKDMKVFGLFVGNGKMDWNISPEDYTVLFMV